MPYDDQSPAPLDIDRPRTIRNVARVAIAIVAAYFVLKVVIVVFALAISLLATVALVLFLAVVMAALHLALRRRRSA